MKKIISIPVRSLCPQCGSGRMLARCVDRVPRVGLYDSVVYRECSNPKCGYRAKTKEEHIGIEIDIPDIADTNLFGCISDNETT